MSNVEKKIAEILTAKKLTLTVAESCTGGLVSSRLTDVSGSSAYIRQNFVTYSNDAKKKYLNVNADTLSKYGAVSVETVQEMASGILKNTDADIALAISGIAGPKNDGSEKPVGLLYIAVANKKAIEVKQFQAEKLYERTKMKSVFSEEALQCLLEFLKKYY